MDIQRFVNKNDPNEKIFHSNAYARVAHGDSLGSTDAQSFQQRLHVHRNRQNVRHYGDSLIGRGDMREVSQMQEDNPLRASGGDEPRRPGVNPRGIGIPQRPGGPSSAPAPRPSFREPPSRGYNPFS